MREIRDPGTVRAILNDPGFVVPPVPPDATGIAWLRGAVARFATGPDHARRRALAQKLIDAIDPAVVANGHPVTALAAALGIRVPVAELVGEAAQGYRPGTGDDARAGEAVDRLVGLLGAYDESTAALIGVLVQACDATTTLRARAAERPVTEVLRLDPPVPWTKRLALVDGHGVAAGEIVSLALAGDLAFGAGPHRCPGRTLALVMAAGPATD